MKPLVILRPEPGNAATCEGARALGLDPFACSLFAVEPLAWCAPDPAHYHALLLTSANALRHGGPGLFALAKLPVVAVGAATADAARAAGRVLLCVGSDGVEALLAAIPGHQRLLHLAGADHVAVASPHQVDVIAVYRAVAIDDPRLPDLAGSVAAVHSARAGARLAALVDDRSRTTIAAISAAAAAACGSGWGRIDVAEHPHDTALLALAARLCQD